MAAFGGLRSDWVERARSVTLDLCIAHQPPSRDWHIEVRPAAISPDQRQRPPGRPSLCLTNVRDFRYAAAVALPKFKTLEKAALKKRSRAELDAILPKVKSAAALKKLADDRALSAMGKSVMRAGFYWKVVEAKWPEMEKLLFGFDPKFVARLSPIEIGELLDDERIIRHRKKLLAIRDNATFVLDVAREHQSFGRFLATWPEDDVVGLWLLLKKRGSRLGGRTGPMTLRHLGKDTFLLTRDTEAVLRNAGVLDGPATSQKAMRAAEAAFFAWRDESGLPLAHISRVVACAVG